MMIRETMERWYVKPAAVTLATALALGGCARRNDSPERKPEACTIVASRQSENEMAFDFRGSVNQRQGVSERIDYGDGKAEIRTDSGMFSHIYKEAGRYAVTGSVLYRNGSDIISQPCIDVIVEIPRK